ncbi:MAG: hypothetical protein AB7S93_10035 [Xanthobacteraceae bacterium]
MRAIASISNVSLTEGGDVLIEIEFQDGSRERFISKAEAVADLILRLSSQSVVAASPDGTLRQEYVVAHETGKGRVLLQVRVSKEQDMRLILGHQTAAKMGRDLVDAAEQSLQPRS